MFLKNTKNKIIELAKNAVMVAEAELGNGKGEEKKKMAINYVLKNLPLPTFIKNILFIILSGFIDDAIELAVNYMKSLPKIQGD
nr:MAG TPA: holin [Caudoviricetes sp.]